MRTMTTREKFLEPESRDGVEVSAEMKAAWKVLLDMLEEFIRICEKYDLKYCIKRNKIIFKYPHKELENLYTKTSVSELKMASIHDAILKDEEYDIPDEFFKTESKDAYIPVFARENKERA